MARKISFVSYKGGVGKTSLTVNLAVCLAQEGYRVLLVDLDTQANASIWLLRLKRWNRLNATGEGAIYSIFNPGTATLADCVVRDVIESTDGTTLVPGLDLVPTTFNLVDLESDLEHGNPDKAPYTIFQEQLLEIEKDYDFILFDCPPDTMRASQCGIFSSDEVYVPANPDALSLIGFTLLGEKLQKLRWAASAYRINGTDSPAEICGVVFNCVREEGDIEIAEMRMRVRLNQFRSHKLAAADARIFKARIRDTDVVRRAFTVGLPVPLLASRTTETAEICADYRNLALELIHHTPARVCEYGELEQSVAGF